MGIVCGINTAIYPPLVYGLVGKSPHIHVGPFLLCKNYFKIVANMLYSSVSPVIQPDSPEYINACSLVVFLSAMFLLLFSILQLGFITCLLSDTVLSSFICACAFNITGTQLPGLFGYKKYQKDTGPFFHQLKRMFELITNSNKNTVGLTIIIIIFQLTMKRLLMKNKYTRVVPADVSCSFSVVVCSNPWNFVFISL